MLLVVVRVEELWCIGVPSLLLCLIFCSSHLDPAKTWKDYTYPNNVAKVTKMTIPLKPLCQVDACMVCLTQTKTLYIHMSNQCRPVDSQGRLWQSMTRMSNIIFCLRLCNNEDYARGGVTSRLQGIVAAFVQILFTSSAWLRAASLSWSNETNWSNTLVPEGRKAISIKQDLHSISEAQSTWYLATWMHWLR